MINWKDLMQYRWQALLISVLITLIALGGIAYQGGLLYGIEFTGGFRMMFEFDSEITPDRLAEFRDQFVDQSYEATITTFGVDGEMRGLMITTRTYEVVNEVTDRLLEAGRSGNRDIFEQLSSEEGFRFLSEQALEQRFRFGTGGDADRIDLTRADRSTIATQTRSIINQSFRRSVVQRLRQQYVESDGAIDLNWVSVPDLREWLERNQLDSFIDTLSNRLSEAQTVQDLRPVLEQYQINPEAFGQIFSVGDRQGRLSLRERSPEQLRDIFQEEFFAGRYQAEAEFLVQRRENQGLYASVEQALSAERLSHLDRERLMSTASLSPFRLLRGEMISPDIGTELVWNALYAILLSMLGVLGYLYLRFELTYSVGAIIAIIHDVIITVGLITMFGIEFNGPVVAAILTVIGYSLNDTIVNFDRVRENRTLMGFRPSWYEVINRSVFEVLPRTFATSITTLIAVVVLYLFGGIALYGFSVVLMIGVVIGTWSSIFVSNSSLLWLQRRFQS